MRCGVKCEVCCEVYEVCCEVCGVWLVMCALVADRVDLRCS